MSSEIFFRSVNMGMIDLRLDPSNSVSKRTMDNVKAFEQTLGRIIVHYRQIYSHLAQNVDTKV